jgi:hypothetical protein
VTYHWKTPNLIRRLIHRVGFRGYFLATLALVDIFQGLNFIHPGSVVHGMPDGPRRVVIWAWITTAVWVMSRLPEPPWDLIDFNEEIGHSGEIPAHGEGGEDA